ncbi:MAG: hypothetical protein ACP5SH_03180 [Syntrophobacteraceae bacterium]
MANEHRRSDHTVTASPLAGGFMGQNPVDQRTAENFGQRAQTFGNGFPDKYGEKKFSKDEEQVRERARKANRIYKQVCEDLQLNACFFSNFGEWKEYVEGRMSDDEFQDRTTTLAQTMTAELN